MRKVLVAVLLTAAGVLATGGPASAAPRHHHHTGHHVCPPQAGPAEGAAAYVQLQIGLPYEFGFAGPNAFDASGLVVAAYASVGVTVPHNTGLLLAQSTPVDRDALLPGDLVFYGTDTATTVAVYVGDDRVVGVFSEGNGVAYWPIDFSAVYAYGRVVSS